MAFSKNWILVGVVCLLLQACIATHSEPLPIDEDELVDVMFDIHVAEAALSQLPGAPSKDSVANEYYDQIAEIHGIDRATLDTCLVVLQRNPNRSQEIYEKIMEKLEKKKLSKTE